MRKNQLIIAAVCLVLVSMQSCSKKKGCTDLEACNYDAEAEDNDGSCTYSTVWFQDLDGDGKGNVNVSTTACIQPEGYVADDSDNADLLVAPVQRAIVTYVGATWCPPCGAYGDPTKEYMEATHGSNLVLLNVQSGDAISASSEFGPLFGDVFQGFVGSTSIPRAYWSGDNFTMVDRGFSSSAISNNSNADNDINSIVANSPEVGVAAVAAISENTVTVRTLTKFYGTSSQHYIGVYLLEDNVEELQQITGQPAAITDHNNVLRTAASNGNALGIQSMGSSFLSGQEVYGTYTLAVDSAWVAANLQVAVVIWNSNSADGISNAVLVDVN